MFTGIVQGLATVFHISERTNLSKITFEFPQESLVALKRGSSIAINGTCLTATDIINHKVSFDVMAETLRLTNIGQLITGQKVNFERAAKFGDEIGGHLLSGHIHTKAKVSQIDRSENLCIIHLSVSEQWIKYIHPKGFVALNGASLTVGEDVTKNEFCVHLIPETLSLTTFGHSKKGDFVNLEIDSQTQTIVNTIERMGLQLP